ncbi:MAG: DegT/DnrJ/EryC1/StrS family aminotransferase [Candidatus Acidiferrales bacterium]
MPAESAHLPAIAGGRPMFERLLPIVKPEGLPDRSFLKDVSAILESRQLTNGKRVKHFEHAAADFLGVRHCIAVSSCTAGLLLVLRALNLRGEVILPSFTFHSTAHSVVWNGLKPVFADCDPQTFCIDPESVRSRLSPQTSAILAVHLFGNPAPVRLLAEISNHRGVPVVYDAAHAYGSSAGGTRVGAFGVAEVFSFSPTKVLVAGEGGLITTGDAVLAERLRAARNYGDSGSYDPELIGLNARMSEFHAALAVRGLDGVNERVTRRNEIRQRYEQRLQSVPGLCFQCVLAGDRSACKDFSVIVDERQFGQSRDWLVDALQKENIQVRRYFWPPVHRQTLYREVWDSRPLPVTDYVSSRILSLPIYSSLEDEAVEKVCDAIVRMHEFMGRSVAAGV